MKNILTVCIILILANSSTAQSFPSYTYPEFSTRPAFLLQEHFDDDSKYPQKDFFKSYIPLYFHKKIQRMNANQLLKDQFLTKARFSKDEFDIFKIFKDKLTPKVENDLAFENDEIDFSNLVVSDYGVCMGVTSVLRKFNMLAHFDPNNTHKARVPIRQIDEKAWKKYFEKLIDRVMSNKPTVIPEFRDLEELSTYGNFYTYLQRHSLDQWALNNLSIRAGLKEMLLSVKARFNRSKAYKLHRQLKNRLKLHYNPKVYLSQPGKFKESDDIWIHVMQVYEVTERANNGSYQIKLWDPNFPAGSDESFAVVNVTSKGKAYFRNEDGKMEKLSMIDLYRWDDAEIAEILNNYQPFCRKYKAICSQ